MSNGTNLVKRFELALEKFHGAYADAYADAEDRGDARRALSKARESLIAAIANDWQPIETAPKEIVVEYSGIQRYGQNILLWAHGEVVRGRWWHASSGACNFLSDGGHAVHPTHWMPLPAPPAT